MATFTCKTRAGPPGGSEEGETGYRIFSSQMNSESLPSYKQGITFHTAKAINTEVFEDGPLLFFCVQRMPEDTRMLDSDADTPHQSREKAEPTSTCTKSANATDAQAVLPYPVVPPAPGPAAAPPGSF